MHHMEDMYMGVWQGVVMDSLKYYPGPHCPTLLRPAGGPPHKRRSAVWGVARLQGGRPAAVVYPLGHPTPYAYGYVCSLL
jgi:hypothetical protein